VTSPFASVNVFPFSSVRIKARSSMCSKQRSFHFLSILALCRAVVFLKDWKASYAASTASAVSSAPISGTVAIFSSVAGSMTSNVFPDFACTHSALMYPFVWKRSFRLRSANDVGAIASTGLRNAFGDGNGKYGFAAGVQI
jgi:hypothetical protein